jgi:rifampicin phosphotransferase
VSTTGILTADGRPPRTPKAGMLHRAARAGLPVPQGVVIGPDEDPPPAIDLPGPLVVRSSFDGEDGTVRSAAGRYTSVLHVAAERGTLAEAVAVVRASVDEDVDVAEVLVMRQVAARTAGVAVLEPDHPEDLVEVVDGLADGLVGGTVEPRTLQVPRASRRLGPLEGRAAAPRPSPAAAWEGRLAVLLADVRRVFGPSPAAGWDVEWADDGRTCWLVQVRPLLRPTTRNELLTLANHAEILPDLPSDFMTSLIVERGDDLLSWYTTLDPRLPRGRDLMVERAGRPLLNLSLLRDILRTWGLPTALLADSMGGTEDDTTGPDLRRLLRSTPALTRMGIRQLAAVGEARARGAALLRHAHHPAEGFDGLVDLAGRVYAELVTGMFALAGAHALQVAVLARLGVLDEVQRRHPTPAGDLLRDLRGGMAREEVLRRHGHRGIYESDLARPRFVEAPDLLAAAGGRGSPPPVQHSRLGTALLPVWLTARRSLAAREQLRDSGMRAFAVVRRRLLAAAADVLDDPAALWLLTTDEVRSLDAGWRPDEAFLAARRQRRSDREALHVPDPVGRLDPLHPLAVDGEAPLVGRTLVAGVAAGRAWVCSEPPTGEPPFDGPAVLVARAVDGGWAGAFERVEGVVVHLGGDLSHGALILRELGVPTVTGVVDVHRRVRTGDPLELDTASGSVRRG